MARTSARAAAVALAASLQPETVGEARLLAHAFLRGLSPAEALHRIIELSDAHGRSDETLEGLVVVAWLDARGAIFDEFDQRGAQAMVEFPDKFPDSRAQARAVSIDEFSEILRDQAKHAEELAAMGNDIVAGRIPFSMWAQAAGRAATHMWSTIRVLPLSHADEANRTSDEADAVAALGRGAIWDASALVVNTVLPQSIQTAIRRALPRSIVSQATMQDVDFAAAEVVDERPLEDEMRVTWDEDAGQPVSFVRPTEELERERAFVRGALDLVRSLEMLPNIAPQQATDADALIPEITDIDSMLRAGLLSVLGIAVREGLPVYSDDRVLRTLYRGDGVPAFGTVALLSTMQERGLISRDEELEALTSLQVAGAIDLSSEYDD